MLVFLCIFSFIASASAAGTEIQDTYLDRQTWIKDLGVAAAWEAGLSGSGVKVAILDSGLAAAHEDLTAERLMPGRNYTGIGSVYSTTDRTGHGTFISGLLAARRNNGLGIAGLVDGISLMPMKCFDPNAQTTVDMVAQAILDAAAADCDVISMSFGLATPSATLAAAISQAAAKGIILIAAVGDGSKPDPVYPALYDEVIGVGALAADGKAAGFSSADVSVFVTAPGENLTSLWHTARDDYKGDGYGTSYAAAFVTAMAAMARQFNPAITPEQFKALLAGSSCDLGQPGYDTTYGFGCIDVAAFVRALQRTDGGSRDLDLSLLDAARTVSCDDPVSTATTGATETAESSTATAIASQGTSTAGEPTGVASEENGGQPFNSWPPAIIGLAAVLGGGLAIGKSRQKNRSAGQKQKKL